MVSDFPVERVRHWLGAAFDGLVLSDPFRQALAQVARRVEAGSMWSRLVYWSGRAAGGEDEPLALVTAALMLARVGTGLLDDVQDGEATGAAGEALLVAGGLALAPPWLLGQLYRLGVDAETVAAAQGKYAQALLTVCGGQHEALLQLHEPVPFERYEAIVEARTAAFCGLACALPARVAGQPPVGQVAFAEFGRCVGHLYQVHNDWRGLDPRAGVSDVGRRWTWPTLYAFQQGDAATRAALLSCWQRDSDQARVLAIRAGAPQFMVLLTERYMEATRRTLASLPGSAEAKAQLADVVTAFRLGGQSAP